MRLIRGCVGEDSASCDGYGAQDAKTCGSNVTLWEYAAKERHRRRCLPSACDVMEPSLYPLNELIDASHMSILSLQTNCDTEHCT